MFSTRYRYLPFLMCLFPLLFFTYQFVLRLLPGLIMHQIRQKFSIDASNFGLFAAFYYYGYAGMQIPVAILLERFSARYIIFVFAILCGFAMFMFIHTNNFYLAVFSRFLIGAGSAVGFLGVSKVVSEWFSQEQYARMIGFSFTIGLTGAIYGGKPISLLIEQYRWQDVSAIIATISIIIGCCVYILLRSPKNVNKTVQKEQFKIANFRALISSPIILSLGFANLLMVGSLEGFADVWGVPYLMKAYDLNQGDAAGFVSFVFFGMLFGGPLLAWFSKKLGYYSVIVASGLGMALAFVILLLSNTYSPMLLSCLFFLVGIMCCYQVIVFAIGANLVEKQNLGLTIAFLNCINMLGGSFFHISIGKIMDICWVGSLNSDGIKIYNLEAYKYALSIIPICAIIGAILVGIIGAKVKLCQRQLKMDLS